MNFLTYGSKENPPLLLIHGLAATALSCYEEILPYLSEYYVVLCEMDGHSDTVRNNFISLDDSCAKIENYVQKELDGKIYGLIGFSMGATLCVELLSRNHIHTEKTLLDAPYTIRMGLMKEPYKFIFPKGIARMQKGKWIPKSLIYMMMGKGNDSCGEMLYGNVSQTTLINACEAIYSYEIPIALRSYTGDMLIWWGSHEYYPAKSAELLRHYVPQLKTEVMEGMGHGQFLHEHPAEYAEKLLSFLSSSR